MSDKSGKKIIVLDIDGTLLNSKKELTPETLKHLLLAQEQGHIVALASGRPYPGMKRFVKELRLDEFGGYALSFNGGMIVECSTGQAIYTKGIHSSFAKKIYEYACERDLGMVTYQKDKVVTGTKIDAYMEFEARLNFMEILQVENFVEYVDFEMPKCLLTAEDEKAAACEEELAELLAPELNVFRSEPFFIEVTRKGVDKAESIDKLIGMLGMKQQDSICCGDGFNDLTMVQYAGIGVAMGNAQQVVKDAADYITGSCDEDGLVEVLKKFVLY